MTRSIRMGLMALGLVVAFAGGAWTVNAQNRGNERHPVLRASIRQLEAIEDRLQHAPSDFGGHKASAIEAIDHARNELREAIEYDRK